MYATIKFCLISLTNTSPLPEGHERTEDAVERLGAMLDGKTPL